MFDLSLGELAMVGTVALVVLGPERLPAVARSMGQWLSKAQRFVGQVKSDLNRELELSELKQLQDEARQAAQAVSGDLSSLQDAMAQPSGESLAQDQAMQAFDGGRDLLDAAWASPPWRRRYKPGLSVDELAQEVVRLQRQLAVPSALPGMRRKYQPRARVNRVKIYR